jgi:cysteinyl-tRNA synthetase
MISFYNTLTRKYDEFKPLKDSGVSLYTCGPTVYNNLHVGNWVAYIRWDILVRTLIASGYKVTRVMNITDVGHLVSDGDDGEDKMEKGAKREGKTAWEVAKQYTDNFLQGMNELNLIDPTYITKATEYIPEQIALVQKLENNGFTYVIDDGVYFDTAKFPKYADFAHLDLEDQEAGARVEYNPQKRNKSDFALWKLSPANETRDMEWESPWGKGFPGWHLECSAMAMDKLGETIDIHTGGIDHIPVHHTNEIAQSEAATGKQFANYWLHNNFLLVDGTKVSKSLGNTFELKDLYAKGFSADDFRMFVLQSHYRTESNFTWENLQAAKNRLLKLYAMADLKFQKYAESNIFDEKENQTYQGMLEGLLRELQDDMDTPSALSFLSSYTEHIMLNGYNKDHFQKFLEGIDELLGFSLSNRENISEDQKDLIIKREKARERKDWALSDEIRDQLLAQGIELKDSESTTIWSKNY